MYRTPSVMGSAHVNRMCGYVGDVLAMTGCIFGRIESPSILHSKNRSAKQGDSRNVSRPVARILMEANIGHLPTKFGYNQMQGWKVINHYRILQVNFHILPHFTCDLLM